jgi:hypothetical protein
MGSMSTTFKLNGRQVSVDALPETPLLWIIREALKLPGTRFALRRGTLRPMHGAHRRRPGTTPMMPDRVLAALAAGR